MRSRMTTCGSSAYEGDGANGAGGNDAGGKDTGAIGAATIGAGTGAGAGATTTAFGGGAVFRTVGRGTGGLLLGALMPGNASNDCSAGSASSTVARDPQKGR
jgi:hypothetical protein